MREPRDILPRHAPPKAAGRRALTLIELLVVVAIVAILAAIAMTSLREAKIRASVVAAKSDIRALSAAAEASRVDNGTYPVPSVTVPDDPLGVVALTALRGLTTPVAYISGAGFADPFGAIRVQGSLSGGAASGMPRQAFNPNRSLLYFYYPHVATLVGEPGLDVEGFAIVSLGPDLKDSFSLYAPFPASLLPARAQTFGILSPLDAIYDPTNGASSGGDIAGYGGEAPGPRMVGGGNP